MGRIFPVYFSCLRRKEEIFGCCFLSEGRVFVAWLLQEEAYLVSDRNSQNRERYGRRQQLSWAGGYILSPQWIDLPPPPPPGFVILICHVGVCICSLPIFSHLSCYLST